jgi:hypothetical protein
VVVFAILRRVFVRRHRETVYDYDRYEVDEYGLNGNEMDAALQDCDIKGFAVMLLAVVAAVLSALLFLLLEDVRNLMVLTDRFTVPTLILFVIELVMNRLATERSDESVEC